MTRLEALRGLIARPTEVAETRLQTETLAEAVLCHTETQTRATREILASLQHETSRERRGLMQAVNIALGWQAELWSERPARTSRYYAAMKELWLSSR